MLKAIRFLFLVYLIILSLNLLPSSHLTYSYGANDNNTHLNRECSSIVLVFPLRWRIYISRTWCSHDCLGKQCLVGEEVWDTEVRNYEELSQSVSSFWVSVFVGVWQEDEDREEVWILMNTICLSLLCWKFSRGNLPHKKTIFFSALHVPISGIY